MNKNSYQKKNNLELLLFNTLTKDKQLFQAINNNSIKMYVCGPTVYQRLHIGNFRSIITYDVLYRILLKKYKNVTYVRNITDVDDKIINEAKKNEMPIEDLTRQTINQFHQDCSFLKCLNPSIEPKATEHIESMVAMIGQLIASGFAYKSENGDVLFDVKKYNKYGQLSNRKLEGMIEGSRISAESKRNGFDFLLWKKADKSLGELGWDTELGFGRPGWHIECSAMSHKYLGEAFDIHGGGIDLAFPHHENEITQTKCCYGEDSSASFWVHNGALNVDGQKMSKSLGNIKYIDLQGNPYIQRYILMSSHYRKPMEYNEHLLKSKTKEWNKLNNLLSEVPERNSIDINNCDIPHFDCLLNDINTVSYFANMNKLVKQVKSIENDSESKKQILKQVYIMAKFLDIIE